MKIKLLVLPLVFVSLFASAEETRIKIAVVDTGIKYSDQASGGLDRKWVCEEHDLTGEGIFDFHGHGTNVAGLVIKNLDPNKYCLSIYKWFSTAQSKRYVMGRAIVRLEEEERVNKSNETNMTKAEIMAANSDAKFVNVSGGGRGSNTDEQTYINKAVKRGQVWFVAAGNEKTDLKKDCDYYPACYHNNQPNFFVVSNYRSGERQVAANYDSTTDNTLGLLSRSQPVGFLKSGVVNVYANGINQWAGGTYLTGTSQATPNALNHFILHGKGN